MKKTIYNAPVISTVTVKTKGMLMQSMIVDGTNTVTSDNQVLSREGSVWDDDGDN